jgi:hypothetical protein
MVHVVTAVKFNAKGVPVMLKMGQADGATGQWVSEPKEVTASDVADMLLSGDTVTTVFEVDGHRVAGPKLQYVNLVDGRETVAIEGEPQPGRTLADLPQF